MINKIPELPLLITEIKSSNIIFKHTQHRCFLGKHLVNYLKDNFKLDKEKINEICQELIEESYIFEIHSDSQIFEPKSIYTINPNERENFLLSKSLHSHLSRLLSENFFLLKILISFVETINDKSVTILLAHYLESTNQSQKFLKHFFLERIEKINKNNFTLFRDDGLDSKILCGLFKIYGKEYLRDLLNPYFKIIMSSPNEFEIEKEKLCDDIFLQPHQLLVRNIVNKLLGDICGSFLKIPNELKKLLHFIRKTMEEAILKDTKFSSIDTSNITVKIIGSVFFLRYLTRAIAFPEEIFPEFEISNELRKPFLLIAKIIQSVLNKKAMEMEENLYFAGGVIERYSKKIENFCDEISSNKVMETSSEFSNEELKIDEEVVFKTTGYMNLGIDKKDNLEKKNKMQKILGVFEPKFFLIEKKKPKFNLEQTFFNKKIFSVSHCLSQIVDFLDHHCEELMIWLEVNMSHDKEKYQFQSIRNLLVLLITMRNKHGLLSHNFEKQQKFRLNLTSLSENAVVSPRKDTQKERRKSGGSVSTKYEIGLSPRGSDTRSRKSENIFKNENPPFRLSINKIDISSPRFRFKDNSIPVSPRSRTHYNPPNISSTLYTPRERVSHNWTYGIDDDK